MVQEWGFLMIGCINEYSSRRDNFDLCTYWNRDNDDYDLTELTHSVKPSGKFYAKEISPYTYRKQEISGSFLFDEATITIETNDVVDIKSGDIVKYDEEFWHVLDVQKKEIHKHKQFINVKYATTYLRLKR